MNEPLCTIIIVSWNVRDLLRRCLNALPAACGELPNQVIVVDNASSDNTAEMVRTSFPEVKLITQPKNIGFARANNAAMELARGSLVLFLNPDTEPKVDSVAKLADEMLRDPALGIIGPKLLNSDGSFQPSVRRFPTFVVALLIMLKIQHLLPNLRVLRRYYYRDLDPGRPVHVDQVMGACMMVQRQPFDAIGRFDPKYYLWFEEVDLCKRMINAGWRVRFFPEAVVVHFGGQSFNQLDSSKRAWQFSRSFRRFLHKYSGRLPALLIDIITPLSVILTWLASPNRKPRVV